MGGIKAHYVPKFYLKNFGDRIYLYDKQARKSRPSAPQNVALQPDFYVDSDSDAASKLEDTMSQFEGNANTVMANIIQTESIAELSNTDKMTLCEFVAFQFSRTPEFRQGRYDMRQHVLDSLGRQTGVTDWRLKVKEEYVKPLHLTSMFDYVDRAVRYFLQMKVCLLKNNTNMPLWTSDNPVVRHNDLTDKLGLGSPGVQFNLPLTPKLLLFFYDDAYINLLDAAAQDAGVSKERRILACNNILETVNMEKANVIHANHLQTKFSTRFIFSNKRRFPMMKAFLEANGKRRMM